MLRRTLAVFAITATVALGLAGPARGQAPEDLESYRAGSSATALVLTLLGQDLAVSNTQAAVASPEATASANGAALLLAGTPVPGEAPVTATDGENKVDSTSACPVDLSPITDALGAVEIDIACVTTSAAVTDGAPAASSQSGEVIIRINGLADGLLGELAPVLEQVLAPLQDAGETVVNELCNGALAALGVCELVEGTLQIDIEALVGEIFDNLGEATNGLFTLAEIAVAPTVSKASADATTGVVAESAGGAVVISLFPGLEASIEALTGLIPSADEASPLLKVTLGQATARVVRDPATGAAAPDASAAQLLGVELTDSLGIVAGLLETTVPELLDSLSAVTGALSCEGGALADVICVDLGAVNDLDAAELEARGMGFGAGTVGKEASAATIRVLPVLAEVLGGDVLGLSLAQATAAANAVVAEAPITPQQNPPDQERSLPKTGGAPALPLVLALFAVGAAGTVVLRRSRTV